ncbi:hypothetical protein BJ973_003062 [Actinoplanes tereljensis]|uniref:Lipoyl-binding domain-containing protein n=1 Tax=Paractinoplanes tereljensis TaxID=571912 RepID=A0A919TY34_9ACTN|nr:lipoyl domain-containing protein [Actinoplanes tereljensis]GIF25789.1 hypothetical protein Ate02nite_85190 [Actinoplanes tereljensis]
MGAVWDVAFPVVMVLSGIGALASAIWDRDGLGPTSWRSGLIYAFVWLSLAGAAVLGDGTPRVERQWKGAVAVLLGLAFIVHFWKRYRLRRGGGARKETADPFVAMSVPDRDDLVAVVMPSLGEEITELTVIRWLKAVGDDVATGEPLFAISTDKVETEVPAAVSGVLWRIDAAEGVTAPVGAVLAVIEVPSALLDG